MVKKLTQSAILLTLLATTAAFSSLCPELQNAAGTYTDIESFTANMSIDHVSPNDTHDASGISARIKGSHCTYLVDVTSQGLEDDANDAQQIAQAIKQDMGQRLGPYRHINRRIKTNAICYKGSFTSKDKAYPYQCQIEFSTSRF